MNLNHIAGRVLNTPLLLEPGYARTFFSALAGRLGIAQLVDAEGEVFTGESLRMKASSFDSPRDRQRPYQISGGVGVIPVSGSLVHKFGHLQPYSGMTGYDGIISRAADAFSDPDVTGVMLDMDTPGGEVSGCFNASRKLRELADTSGKPFWALCYDMNCSAGMALASSAHRRLITETGIAGSVGVVMGHVSYEKQLEQSGMKVTLIHSGAQKVNGNPYTDLPAEVLEQFQNETHILRGEFAQLVADHLGMSLEAVLATEAATYRGSAAVDVGFADELVNGLDAIALMSEHLSSQGRTISLGVTMSQDETQPQAETPETQSPAAGAQPPEPAADMAKVQAQAAADAQARVAGILQLDEAKGREATANHLAFNTTMSVDDAKVLLATVPDGTSTDVMNTALDRAMAEEEQPNVGADTDSSAEESTEEGAASYVATWKQVKGVA